MTFRLSNIAILVFWLASMTWLVARDVLPNYLADEPPGIAAIIQQGPKVYRSRILDAAGRQLGFSEITVRPLQDALRVSSQSELQYPVLGRLARLRITSALVYDQRGRLEQFDLDVFGLPMPVSVRVENFGVDFSAEMKIGLFRKQVIFDARTAQRLSQMLQPFFMLPDLYVGKAWRIWMFDPLTPNQFQPVLVKVTGREPIRHGERTVLAFRIEGPNGLTAWADEQGRVLRQELTLPLLGRITIVDDSTAERSP